LADIGKRYKASELIESILKPSEKIAQGYETQAVLLLSGKVLSGFVVSENGRHIAIRDSQGKTHVIPRDEIDERSRQQVSAMPEGLASSLDPQQLADLIAYLQSL
jgi:putative heme-binding domain-containing protein